MRVLSNCNSIQSIVSKLCGSALLLALFSVAFPSRGNAQATTADLLGAVADATGGVVPNATVVLTNTDTGSKRSGVSSGSGEFTFTLLEPGHYSLKVTAPTFKQFEAGGILLSAGDRLRVDASMIAGAAGETVTVEAASSSALQTDSSTIQTSVVAKQVQDLPLNGRNFTSLVDLAPGVNAGNPAGIPAGGAPDDRRQSSSVVANGQSYLQNNQLIDGLDNNEREQGVIGVRPSIDAIQEIRVITTNYPAEVGRASGAVVNIITKAGTNQFHGSAYEFFRNDIFDGRNFFSVTGPKPELRQNQYGGSLGGPMFRDKTFFFGAFEGLREVTGVPDTETVPTLFEEQNPGNFSDVVNPTTKVPGPILTAAQISPVSLNYFKLYPAPNTAGIIDAVTGTPLENYNFSPRQTLNSITVDARIDHHFNENNQLFGHYSYNPVDVFTPGKLPPATAFGQTVQSGGVESFGAVFGAIGGPSHIRAQGIALSYLHLFNSRLALELKSGFTRVNIQSLPLNYGTNLGSKFGVINSNLGTADTSGLASMLFFSGPYASLGDGYFVPILNRNNNFQYDGAATYTKGAHTFKFGAAVVRRQLNYFQDQFSPQGGFAFFGSGVEAMANFLSGDAGFGQRGNLLVHPGYRMWEPSAFAQDDWRVNQSLTLNLGVRYDIETPFTVAHNQYSNFNVPTLTVQIAGQTTSPTLGINTHYKDFSPRVGFALSLPGQAVVRGGFGLGFFPVDFQNVIQNGNPPYSYLCFPCFTTRFPTLPLPAAGSVTNPSGGVTYKPSNFGPGYNEQYNLTVQKDIKGNVLTASYVGLLGRKLLAEHNLDQPLPHGPYAGYVPGVDPAPAPPPYVYATQLPGVTSISYNYNGAVSNYNAMQLVYDRRARRGLTLSANYTLAHGLIDGSPTGTSQDPTGLITNDIAYDYGNSNIDIRQRVAVTANYELPFGAGTHGLKALALKGYQMNVIGYWQTGLPFTVLDSAAPINLPGVSSDRPNVVGKVSLSSPSIHEWFNPAAFAPQTFGTAGDEKRNQYYGPHDRRADISVFKNIALRDRLQLQIRAECFNVSNTPNFDRPGGLDINGAGLGVITDTVPGEIPRQFQFAAKMQF